MLICPECQHENIEENKFCESCGISLISKSCHQCGEQVLIGKMNCPNCDALTIDIHQLIVVQSKQDSLSLPEFRSSSKDNSEETDSVSYLNSSFRYGVFNEEILDSIRPFWQVENQEFYALPIIDFKPYEKCFLDTVLESIDEVGRQNLIDAGIPSSAFPYLTLAEFSPSIPDLYDAWIDERTNQEFVVISQGDGWESLKDAKTKRDLLFPQMLSYFELMTKLWRNLSKLNCCQTLLQIDNIGINEDDILVMKQICHDDRQNPPSLDQLINIWLELFTEKEIEDKNIISQLLDLYHSGDIQNIKQLRAKLPILLQEFQLKSLLEEDNTPLLLTSEEELKELTEQFNFEDDDLPKDFVEESTGITGDIDDQPTVVLPMQLLNLTDGGLTDIGRRRSHNEDCFSINSKITKHETPQGVKFEGRGLYIVCDGMGGHSAGEVASAMAVQTIADYFHQNWLETFPTEEDINNAILSANKVIYDANIAKGSSGNQRMGTTLVLLLIEGNKLAIAHVGDSRIYRFTRKWGLEQLTTDHSVAQMEMKNGVSRELAYQRMDAYQLTQALGPRDNNFVHPDVKISEIKEDALFILCSDGLSDNDLLENHGETHLSNLISFKSNLHTGLIEIIDLANQINGHDNITCVLVRVKVQPHLNN